jgi:hypothetical protein
LLHGAHSADTNTIFIGRSLFTISATVVVIASLFARTTVNRRAVASTARAEDANVVRVALRHRTSRTVSLTFIHARSRRRRVDHHRPRRRVATTRAMPTHRARGRLSVH